MNVSRHRLLQALSFRVVSVARIVLFLALALPLCQRSSAQAAARARIIAPPASFRWPEDLKLVYSVQWHMLHAGTSTILIRLSHAGEHFHATADTSGMTNKIYPVHDTFDAEVDPHNFCTQNVIRHAEEGSRRLDRKMRFDYAAAKVLVDDFDLKSGAKKHHENDISNCVTDVVSGFFYAGSLPLNAGLSETFPVNDGGKTSDVKIDVEDRASIRVPSGEFQTVRVKAESVSGPLKGKGELWVWFTDDERHIPVQMKSKLGFATLLFQLQSISQEPR
jgi:hypothetical protein